MEQTIKELVNKTEFTYEELLSNERNARLVIVRHLLFLHLRRLGHTVTSVGKAMNRDHSNVVTCSHSIRGHLQMKDTLVMVYVNKMELNLNDLLKG